MRLGLLLVGIAWLAASVGAQHTPKPASFACPVSQPNRREYEYKNEFLATSQAWRTGIGGGRWFSRNEVSVDALHQRATYYRRPSTGRLGTATAGSYPCRLWRHRFSIHRIDLPNSGLLGSNGPRWQWSPEVCNSGREDR
jgi:hypothetical protein